MFDNDPIPKKIVKYSILLTIKESYLFVRNFLGLIFHPFKTLRALFREHDYSQIFLVLGFPVYGLICGLGLIWLTRRLVGVTPGVWGLPTKGGVSFLLLATCYLLLYLGYWLWQVWRVKKRA